MIRSMTAFARNLDSDLNQGWEIEIRSVNHRFLEYSVKAPSSVASCEGRLKQMTQNKLKRGKVTVSISFLADTESSPRKVVIDEALVHSYLNAVAALKSNLNLSGELGLKDVLMLPKVFTTESEKELSQDLWNSLEREYLTALDLMVQNRELEGNKLFQDISARLESIQKACLQIKSMAMGQSDRTMKRLSERLQAILKESAMDQDRLYREVAFLVERSDVTEELVRLESHLALFFKRLESSEEVGRELDFLCQEMNREINTLGAKSQLFEISTEVIHMKTELEKIREQVQNIE